MAGFTGYCIYSAHEGLFAVELEETKCLSQTSFFHGGKNVTLGTGPKLTACAVIYLAL